MPVLHGQTIAVPDSVASRRRPALLPCWEVCRIGRASHVGQPNVARRRLYRRFRQAADSAPSFRAVASTPTSLREGFGWWAPRPGVGMMLGAKLPAAQRTVSGAGGSPTASVGHVRVGYGAMKSGRLERVRDMRPLMRLATSGARTHRGWVDRLPRAPLGRARLQRRQTPLTRQPRC